jgi:cell division protein FtsA
MSGVRLEAKVQIITGSVTAVQNLLKCCERAGLQVIDIVLEPLASSLAVLSENEMQEGVALVDIGGGTTDIAVYRGGSLVHTSVIAVGGNHVTNDIAVGLRLPVEEAERVKRLYGSAVPVVEDEGQLVEILVGGHEPKAIPKGHIAEITVPRCEELFELIKGELLSSGTYDLLNYGVVITGGASKMKGMKKMAEMVLEMPVRIGAPRGGDNGNAIFPIRFSAREYMDPKYSTVVGLVLYGAQSEAGAFSNGDLFGAILKKMKQWVRNLRAWPGRLF